MPLNSALDLIRLQIQTLFLCAPGGQLRFVREPGREEAVSRPAPRFFLGRTVEGNDWRFRFDQPGALVSGITRLCLAEPVSANLEDPPRNREAVRAVLSSYTPITSEYRGPAYLIPRGIGAPANAVMITAANAHLLETNFPWALETPPAYQSGPLTAVVEQGSAVSVCFCSRLSPWAAEAGVETVEAFRGRGYASAVVAAWAAAVHSRELVALYSTWWENMASRSIARKLGMTLYGEDWWVG